MDDLQTDLETLIDPTPDERVVTQLEIHDDENKNMGHQKMVAELIFERHQ